jgi:hypothetical protein
MGHGRYGESLVTKEEFVELVGIMPSNELLLCWERSTDERNERLRTGRSTGYAWTEMDGLPMCTLYRVNRNWLYGSDGNCYILDVSEEVGLEVWHIWEKVS